MKIELFHIIFLILCSQASFSQADSLEVGQDPIKSSEEKYDRMYKLFVEDQDREIKRLWKLNLVDLAYLGPNLSLEQRLGKHFTSETYLGLKQLNWGGYYGFTISSLFDQQLKYYYNIDRRKQKGKRVNGFSANYFALETYMLYKQEPKARYYDQPDIQQPSVFKAESFDKGIGLYYGLQRRIGNVGYIDLYLGLRYGYMNFKGYYSAFTFQSSANYYSNNYYHFTPVFGVRAGFAIDSFKNLKYMLK